MEAMIKNNLMLTFLLVLIPSFVVITMKVLKYADDVFGCGDFAKKIEPFLKEVYLNRIPSKFFVNSILLMDIVFGEKIFSWRSFLISSMISFLWIIIFVGLSLIVYSEQLVWFRNSQFSVVLLKSVYVVLIGLLIDYLSVCLTRYLFRLSENKCFSIQIVFIVIDFICSILLFSFCYTLFKSSILEKMSFSLTNIFENLYFWINNPWRIHSLFVFLEDTYLIEKGKGVYDIVGGTSEVIFAFPEGILFLTSLLTSIWMWMFLLSYLTQVVCAKHEHFKKILIKESAISSKPILSLGVIIFILLIPLWLFSIIITCLFYFL